MSTPHMFDRAGLIAAFNVIGEAALANGTRLELAVYGGAAMMLASNFRFATEDVDIAEIEAPWPDWLVETVKSIAEQNRWAKDWLNEAVTLHLSPLADRAADHIEFGSFPQDGAPGLDIVVPTAPYLLALKLKAIRVLDAVKGEREAADIRGLMASLAVDTEGAMEILRRYFPVSAADGGKQEFFLRHLGQAPEGESDAPCYGR